MNNKAEGLAADAAAGQLPTAKDGVLVEGLVASLSGDAKRKRVRRNNAIAAMVLADLIVICSAVLIWSFGYMEADVASEQALKLMAILLPVHLLAGVNNGAFLVQVDMPRSVPLWRALGAFSYGAFGVLLFVFLAKVSLDFSRVVVTGSVASAAVGLALGRVILNRWARGHIGPRAYTTLCIYDRVPLSEAAGFTRISAERFGLSANASDPDMIARLSALTSEFDRLVIHCRPEDREDWAFVLKSLSLPSEIALPEINALSPVSIHRRSNGVSVMITAGPLHWQQRAIKRLFDIGVTLATLPAMLPLFIVLAIAIKLDSKGPVIFKQDRIGLNNKPFKIFKFRTMRTELLDPDGENSTRRGDPRITRFGAFLRKTSMDELPQLINVLKGDMSVVGPRPHARQSRAGERLFWEVDNSYWHRHTVKPGITGLAQVRGHRGNTFHEEHLRHRLRSDLEYVAEWSLLTDLLIVFRTVGVLMHKNAF